MISEFGTSVLATRLTTAGFYVSSAAQGTLNLIHAYHGVSEKQAGPI